MNKVQWPALHFKITPPTIWQECCKSLLDHSKKKCGEPPCLEHTATVDAAAATDRITSCISLSTNVQRLVDVHALTNSIRCRQLREFQSSTGQESMIAETFLKFQTFFRGFSLQKKLLKCIFCSNFRVFIKASLVMSVN